MAKTHAIFHSSRMTATNVDAYNLCGIPAADLDNGVAVTLNGMNIDGTSHAAEGFEYAVAVAGNTSKHVWLLASPTNGYENLEAQVYNDPRYFYNESGKPASIKFLNPLVDVIEIDAKGFVSGNLPATTDKYVTIGTGGKFVASTTAPQTDVTYFSIEGFHSVQVGTEVVSTVLLRCVAN